MTAEPIAAVVSDLLHRRVKPMVEPKLQRTAQNLIINPTVVDATAIYETGMKKVLGEGIYPYEDHPEIAPPWDEAAICYVNRHGNVMVMHCSVHWMADDERGSPPTGFVDGSPECDWDRVRWVVWCFVWTGGRDGQGEAMATRGPVHLWQLAIYDDGGPGDIHWVQLLPQQPKDIWEPTQIVLLETLNFLNFKNIDIIEPSRPRPERRRLQRLGVKVHTINVFPPGKRTRSTRGEPLAEGVPFSPVRGHHAHYGPRYDKGLLFGKLEGKFWIPGHTRGNAELGESKPDYRVMTKETSNG